MLARGRRPGRADRASSAARTTSGSPARPGRAGPARSSTSTAAPTSAPTTTAPATTPSASSSSGTSSSCSTSSRRTARCPSCPRKNIDTGMGLERMAAILQDVPSVFETDLFRPLVELGEELSGPKLRRGLRDHPRAARARRPRPRGDRSCSPTAWCPSNEDRGYILRRIMRRAIQQGHVLGIDEPLPACSCATRVRDVMGDAYPELQTRVAARSSAGRAPRRRASAARSSRASGCSPRWSSARRRTDLLGLRGGRLQAPRHLRLPLRDDQGAARRGGPVGRRPGLRGADGARARGVAPRQSARAPRPSRRRRRVHVEHDEVLRFARDAGFRTRFVGYETTEADTVLARRRARQRLAAREARGEPLLPRGRRPGLRQRRRRDAVRPRAGGRRLPRGRRPGAGARAGRGRDRRGGDGARGRRARPRGSRPCATTPPPTCCTRRCASGSARTCARPARTWARTSCASTSPTASGSRPRSWPRWSGS